MMVLRQTIFEGLQLVFLDCCETFVSKLRFFQLEFFIGHQRYYSRKHNHYYVCRFYLKVIQIKIGAMYCRFVSNGIQNYPLMANKFVMFLGEVARLTHEFLDSGCEDNKCDASKEQAEFCPTTEFQYDNETRYRGDGKGDHDVLQAGKGNAL